MPFVDRTQCARRPRVRSVGHATIRRGAALFPAAPRRAAFLSAAFRPAVLLPAVLVMAMIASTAVAPLAARAESPLVASTSRESREDAVRSIPFDKLDEKSRSKLWDVVSDPSVFRRMPTQMVDCDPDLFVFLVRHPEVVVNVWDLMGVTTANIKRVDPFRFDADDGAGTASRVELVYGDANTHVLYAEGKYDGPLAARAINGRCVIVLRSEYMQGDNERTYVTTRLDVFLRVDRFAAELVAKTLQPLVGKTADQNFAESTQFLGRLSRAAERNGAGVQRMSSKLTRVDPSVRAEFAQLAATINHRAVLHSAEADEATSGEESADDADIATAPRGERSPQ